MSTPLAVILVSGVSPVPSVFTRQMLEAWLAFGASVPSSLREDRKTTLEPSGDHCGRPLPAPLAVALVMGLKPVPSAFTRQMLEVPGVSVPSTLRVDAKTTLEPSGDHCGKAAPAPVALVSGVSPVPSAFTRQMLEVPGASVPSSLREE